MGPFGNVARPQWIDSPDSMPGGTDFGMQPSQVMNPNPIIFNNQIVNPNIAAGREMTPNQLMQGMMPPPAPRPMTKEEMIIMQLMGAPLGTGT